MTKPTTVPTTTARGRLQRAAVAFAERRRAGGPGDVVALERAARMFAEARRIEQALIDASPPPPPKSKRELLLDVLRALRAIHAADPRSDAYETLAQYVVRAELESVFPATVDKPDLSDASLETYADEMLAAHAENVREYAEAYARDAEEYRAAGDVKNAEANLALAREAAL